MTHFSEFERGWMEGKAEGCRELARLGFQIPRIYLEQVADEMYLWPSLALRVANRDIFGRELWLCAWMVACAKIALTSDDEVLHTSLYSAVQQLKDLS